MTPVGEQPGDAEDIEGEPFVGPAGDARHQMRAEMLGDLRKVAEELVMASEVGAQ